MAGMLPKAAGARFIYQGRARGVGFSTAIELRAKRNRLAAMPMPKAKYTQLPFSECCICVAHYIL